MPCGMLILQVIHDDHEFLERRKYEPKSLALMRSASSPHSEVTVGTIPTTLHGIRFQSQVDYF